jgi:hypothetical protein
MDAHRLSRHFETSGFVPVAPVEIFEHLDDHTQLTAHMSGSSWMMGGGKMETSFDGQAGKSIGSRIGLTGRVFGVELSVEEVITEREPPYRKTWETVGTPKLLVIEHYRLGFDITPKGVGSMLRVSIDYALPRKGLTRLGGLFLGAYYAKWCARQMLADTLARFAPSSKHKEQRAIDL